MTISKESPTGLFEVENPSEEPMAIEVTIKTREVNEEGVEVQNDLPSEEFIIFPEQIILKALEKKSVKIQWIKPRDIEKEESYRVIVEQLPIDFAKKKGKDKKAQIKVLLKYLGALYLTPESAKSKIEFSGSCEKNKLNIVVKNSGNTHQLLNDLKLTFKTKKDGKKSVKLEGKDLGKIEGENILSEHSRKFSISCPEDLQKMKEFSIKGQFEK